MTSQIHGVTQQKRFDGIEVASATPRRGAMFYRLAEKVLMLFAIALLDAMAGATVEHAVAAPPVTTRPAIDASAHSIFMRRMAEKSFKMGLSAAYYENASGLTKNSRVCVADLLTLGLAVAANPTLSRIWSATNRIVTIHGPHARSEEIVHGYTKLRGYPAFQRKHPFLGGKDGSLSYNDLTVRAHVIMTEVTGRRILIALAGQAYSDDPFAADLEICDLMESMLKGRARPPTPTLDALEAKFGAYAFATLDGQLRFESRHSRRLQVPASTTKLMTALCCLDVVKDVSRKMTVRQRDIVGGSGYKCFDGDELTWEDALYSIMLPSSNTLAEAAATAAGELMLPENLR